LLLKWAFEDPVSEEGVRRETCTLEGDTCIFRRPLSISILGFFDGLYSIHFSNFAATN
jgi:hypothetical protein